MRQANHHATIVLDAELLARMDGLVDRSRGITACWPWLDRDLLANWVHLLPPANRRIAEALAAEVAARLPAPLRDGREARLAPE